MHARLSDPSSGRAVVTTCALVVRLALDAREGSGR